MIVTVLTHALVFVIGAAAGGAVAILYQIHSEDPDNEDEDYWHYV